MHCKAINNSWTCANLPGFIDEGRMSLPVLERTRGMANCCAGWVNTSLGGGADTASAASLGFGAGGTSFGGVGGGGSDGVSDWRSGTSDSGGGVSGRSWGDGFGGGGGGGDGSRRVVGTGGGGLVASLACSFLDWYRRMKKGSALEPPLSFKLLKVMSKLPLISSSGFPIIPPKNPRTQKTSV